MSMNMPWKPAILAIIAISLPVMNFMEMRGVISPARIRDRKGFEIAVVVSWMEPMVMVDCGGVWWMVQIGDEGRSIFRCFILKTDVH
jgi:hypothetical protein